MWFLQPNPTSISGSATSVLNVIQSVDRDPSVQNQLNITFSSNSTSNTVPLAILGFANPTNTGSVSINLL